MTTDWAAWHDAYDDPDSPLSRRLAEVQRQVGAGLDRSAPGPIRLLSLCAGRGLDVLPLLAEHARGRDVIGRLVELDPHCCAAAQHAAPDRIEVLQADAGSTDSCAGAVPADLLLLCGIFGNVSDADVGRTVAAVPTLCRSGATVLWTRHRREPDLTAAIRSWFEGAGFTETSFVADGWSVGAAVLTAEPQPFEPGVRMFAFSTRPPR